MGGDVAEKLDAVEALLALCDGSAAAMANVRRAILRATAHLAPDHPARQALDGFHDDMKLVTFSADVSGGAFPAVPDLLLAQWAKVRAQIERGWLH